MKMIWEKCINCIEKKYFILHKNYLRINLFINKINEKIMKTLQEIIKILKKHRDILRSDYNIKSVKIFGSYAEGNQTEKSDIDLIVEFGKTPTLIEVIHIEEELSKLLNTKIDLLTEEGISSYVKPYIREVTVL